jgi:hypothetical protein
MQRFVVFSVILSCLALAAPERGQAAGFVSYPLAAGINAEYQAGASGPSSDKLAALNDPKSTEATPIGNWVEFVFQKTKVVTKVTIANGFKDKRNYARHGRLRAVTLELDGGVNLVLTLPDSPKAKTFRVPNVKTAKVRLVPQGVYPGSDSKTPYLSLVRFSGYDPSEKQIVVTGEFKECKIDPAHSADQFHCGYFQAVDGTKYGCADDLCYHPPGQVGRQVVVTGVAGADNVLTVLDAKPTQ